MVRLIEAGMDVARLNFSHGVREQHQKVIDNLKQASAITGEHVTILQDLGGPKIRTGLLEQKSVTLGTGDVFTFTTREVSGSAKIVSTTF